MGRCAVFASLCVWCCLSGVASAEPERIPAYKTATPPTIDGVIDEKEWAGAPAFEGLQDDNNGKPAPVNSRFWLAYDDEFVYFAAKNYDSDPKSIRAVEYRTNTDMPGDDNVTLYLDVSGALSEVNEFKVNPKGATNVELAGGRAAKREWTGEFVARARITSEGWECEARIPWQIMSLPGKGKRDLRFDVSRYVSRLGNGYIHVYTESGNAKNLPYWTGVELPKPFVDRSIKLLPYIYAGYDENVHDVFNSGLDLKTQLSDRITFVGTVNPDFRNIENQILSLDFSRFARIADESRPFFLEGADYMESALWASQRIGQFDTGVNTYGRLSDRTSFGLVDTIDFNHQNAFATNVTYDADTNNSYRASLTSFTEPGVENTAYMLRYSKEMGPWQLFTRTMGSQDNVEGYGGNHTIDLGYNRDTIHSDLSYTYCDPDFDPKLGFFSDRDFKGWEAFGGDFKNYAKGPLLFRGMGVFASYYDHIDGDPYHKGIGGFGDITLRNQLGLHAEYNHSTFEGAVDQTFGVGLTYPQNDPYRKQNISVTQGTIDGSLYRLVSYNAGFRPWKRFQVTFSHQDFLLGETAKQSILGLNYDLGRDRSISGRAVRSQNDTNWYLAYRKSGNRGAEYYVIIGDPNAPRFTKSLIVKAVIPFEVGGASKVSHKAVLGDR